MSNIINITDRLSNERSKIQIGDKLFEVNDSLAVVMKFEELTSSNGVEGILSAIELSLGKEAVKEVKKYSIKAMKTIVTAILAAMQDITFDEAESRFQVKD